MLLTLSACCHLPSKVDVPNNTLYFLKEASQDQWAVEMHFLDSSTAQVTLDQWLALSTPTPGHGMVCQDLTDWAAINKMVSDFCSARGIDCSYEVQPGLSVRGILNGFFQRLSAASGAMFHEI